MLCDQSMLCIITPLFSPIWFLVREVHEKTWQVCYVSKAYQSRDLTSVQPYKYMHVTEVPKVALTNYPLVCMFVREIIACYIVGLYRCVIEPYSTAFCFFHAYIDA